MRTIALAHDAVDLFNTSVRMALSDLCRAHIGPLKTVALLVLQQGWKTRKLNQPHEETKLKPYVASTVVI